MSIVEKSITCGFTILIDSREQRPYTFDDMRANADQGHAIIKVPTRREALPIGDYMLGGLPHFVVERKSAADLYSSISQGRANFEDRLRRMVSRFTWSAIVVEAELSDLLTNPPPHTQYSPKSLGRTLQAWSIRYSTVHWWFLPGREAAERWTFRLLERFWADYQGDKIALCGQEIDRGIDQL